MQARSTTINYAAFAYLCDVYVADQHRGRGLGEWLIGMVKQHPQLQGLRWFMLGTLKFPDFCVADILLAVKQI